MLPSTLCTFNTICGREGGREEGGRKREGERKRRMEERRKRERKKRREGVTDVTGILEVWYRLNERTNSLLCVL